MTVSLSFDNKELAQTYDKISDSQFKRGLVLVKKLGIKAGNSVLDVGCGTGRLGLHILDKIGEAGRLIGIDPLADRIKIANEKNEYPNAAFQIGVAEDLAFIPDNSIDVVYLNCVFHWVLDKKTALQEMFRVLKPGGKVGISTNAKELISTLAVRQISDRVLKREPYHQYARVGASVQEQHGTTTTELIQMLVNAGLKVEDVQIKLTKRKFSTAKELMKYWEASTFGNFLNQVPESLREQAKADIEIELEKNRTTKGVEFNGYTIFAVAQK